MKLTKKDFIYYGIILFLLVATIILIVTITSETSKCLANPFTYGASKIGNVSCSCISIGKNMCASKFMFDDNNFSSIKSVCG